MKTKWKYASLPATERLSMVRGGNKEVYDSEIDRSLGVIATRQGEGLDISSQKDWIDSVSYNYNLYNAERMGISPERVAKSGYADRLLQKKSQKSDNGRVGTVSTVTGKSEKDYLAKKYRNDMEDKILSQEKKRAFIEEWLLNNGIDKDTEMGKRYLEEFDKELETLTEKYRKEYISRVKAL